PFSCWVLAPMSYSFRCGHSYNAPVCSRVTRWRPADPKQPGEGLLETPTPRDDQQRDCDRGCKADDAEVDKQREPQPSRRIRALGRRERLFTWRVGRRASERAREDRDDQLVQA